MSNEQAPECCPFCGAGIRIEKDGSQCRAPRGTWVGFNCCTTWHQGYHDQRRLQSLPCILAERERLTRERDEEAAKADHLCVYSTSLETANRQLTKERDDLLARVKRLEQAGDMLQAAVVGVEGMTHWEWLASAHEADLNWRKAKEATP